MFRIVAGSGRFVLATACALLMTTACLPSTYVAKRMPLMVTWVSSGDLELVFPLCQGQAMASLGLTGADHDGHRWTVRNGDKASRVAADEVVQLVVGNTELVSGSLSDRWPVIEAFEPGYPTEVGDFDYLFVRTTNYDAGIHIADIGSTQSWIIDGDTIEHGTSPVEVAHADGLAQIGAFCADQKS